MPLRNITLFSPLLGIVSGTGDATLTLQDTDDNVFELPDQTGDNQSAFLDGSPVTVNAIESALGPQLVTILLDGATVQLSLTPVQVTIEAGLFDDTYIYFPELPPGASITVGLSLPLLFPNDVSVPLCLAAETLIRAENGLKPIGDIEAGELVHTVDSGLQKVLWSSRRTVNFDEMPELKRHQPILVRKNAFGDGQPFRDLILSPQHCVVFDTWEAAYFTGEDAVMAPAHSLANGRTVVRLHDCQQVTYSHILFEEHHVIWAHGMTVESLFLGDLAIGTLATDRQTELLDLFPNIREGIKGIHQRARPRLKGPEAAVMMHALGMRQPSAGSTSYG